MKTANNNGTRIAYETAGDGVPLVLVHANPFDHRLWLYQVARYRRRFRTLAMDLRGYGDSDKPTTPFTLRDMADDVLAVLDAEGIDRAIFMGASVGAGITLLIGLDNPDRVRGLVLVGGGARPGPIFQARRAGYGGPAFASYFATHIRELVGPAFRESELGAWLLQVFIDEAPALSGESIAQIFQALAGFDVFERLPTLAVPTLIVNGEHDLALEASREIAQRVRHSGHIIIPNVGHACCIEDPVAFERAVDPFLRQLSS